MKQFEYLTAFYSNDTRMKQAKIRTWPETYKTSIWTDTWEEDEKVLSVLGNDGWELVTSAPADGIRIGYVILFFKREVIK